MTSISNLEVDEALLTGEAMPVAQIVEPLGASSSHGLPRVPTFSTEGEKTLAPGVGLESREQIAVGDRVNLAFSSTTVTRGRGSGVVIGTGMQTQVCSSLPRLHL